MNRINLNNYEAFVLDHLEGRLSAAGLAELKAFLRAHPELNVDLGSNDLPYLNEENVESPFKDELKKEHDHDVIAYIENLLSKEEKAAFEKRISEDEEYKALFDVYSKTKLVTDASVLFEGKESLIRSEEAWMNADTAFNYVENELSSAERIAFEKELVSDAKLAKDLDLYKKTILVSDVSILYPDKAQLKKEAAVLPLFNVRTALSVAAAILLIVGLIVIFNVYNSSPELKKELSGKEVKAPVKKEETPVNLNREEEKVVKKAIETNNAPSNYVAKKSDRNNETVIDTAARLDEKEKMIAEETNRIKEQIVPSNTIIEVPKDDSLGLAKLSAKEKIKEDMADPMKKIILLAYEADDEVKEEEPRKPGFWQRLAKTAGQANKLGMTAVNGKEGSGEGYLLSFNSLSIEKK